MWSCLRWDLVQHESRILWGTRCCHSPLIGLPAARSAKVATERKTPNRPGGDSSAMTVRCDVVVLGPATRARRSDPGMAVQEETRWRQHTWMAPPLMREELLARPAGERGGWEKKFYFFRRHMKIPWGRDSGTLENKVSKYRKTTKIGHKQKGNRAERTLTITFGVCCVDFDFQTSSVAFWTIFYYITLLDQNKHYTYNTDACGSNEWFTCSIMS